MADVDKDGFFNAAEFCVAMHMVKQHLNGVPLPKTLPPPLKQYAKQEIQFVVTNESQKDRCLEIFERCKNYVHEGVLEGDDTVDGDYFMSRDFLSGKISKFLLAKSKLMPSQLFHIW